MDTHTLTHTHTYTDTDTPPPPPPPPTTHPHTPPPTHPHTHTHTLSPVASPFYVLPLIRHFLAFNSKCTNSSTDRCSILMLMCEKRTSSNPSPDKKFKTFLST